MRFPFLLALISGVACLSAATATAHPGGQSQPPPMRGLGSAPQAQPPGHGPITRGAARRQGPPSQSETRWHRQSYGPPPRHWGRGQTAWERHVHRCRRAYRSYNWRTDMFRLRNGKWRRCRL